MFSNSLFLNAGCRKNVQTGRRISVENVEKKNLSTLVYIILNTVCKHPLLAHSQRFTALTYRVFLAFKTSLICNRFSQALSILS